MAETKTSQLDKNMQLMEDVHSPTLTPSGDALLPERARPRRSVVREQLREWDEPGRAHSRIETAAHLAGRAVLGGFFIYSGINHFLKRQAVANHAESKGVPAADAAVIATGAMMVAGGLSIVAGARPKVGAGLITTFLLGVSPVMHAFWKETDPQQQMHDMVDFTKNMAIVGGAMLAAGHPEPWPFGVDRRRRRHEPEQRH
jgi:putative oxidoreductase